MERAEWKSRIGFVLAVAGSAVGLANIWKFPYTVGKFGGAAFIFCYLLFLFLIGFPTLLSEVLIGRYGRSSPKGSYQKIGGSSWARVGFMTVLTGFLVSSFYSVVAGWVLRYLWEALQGNVVQENIQAAGEHFSSFVHSAKWSGTTHVIFAGICTLVLIFGVQKGIERWSRILMPMLFVVLLALVLRGITLPHSEEALAYLLRPDWSGLTPTAILAALGQAFFTLSLGQGTMVTYGSYLPKKENVVVASLPVVLLDTLVSLLAAVAVFTIVFSVGMQPDAGPGLVFKTLPVAFGKMHGGALLAIAFFLLISIAAVTSEISAMEPMVAYLVDEKGWSRQGAVLACGMGVILCGIPSVFSERVLDGIAFLCTDLLIPLGGLAAVLLVGRVMGKERALEQLSPEGKQFLQRHRWFGNYFWFCLKWSAPLLIVCVLIHALVA